MTIYAPFGDDFIGWPDLLRSTDVPNLKSIFTRYEDMKGDAQSRNFTH